MTFWWNQYRSGDEPNYGIFFRHANIQSMTNSVLPNLPGNVCSNSGPGPGPGVGETTKSHTEAGMYNRLPPSDGIVGTLYPYLGKSRSFHPSHSETVDHILLKCSLEFQAWDNLTLFLRIVSPSGFSKSVKNWDGIKVHAFATYLKKWGQLHM